jgi:hypothetical protein
MNRPMMIDAIAKRNAAAKVRAINFSIRLLPGREPTLGAQSLNSDFPRDNGVVSQCKTGFREGLGVETHGKRGKLEATRSFYE